MRRWLARLAFSFLIIAGWLAWEGYRAATGRVPDASAGRASLYFVAAAMSLSLGLTGLRERHRPGGPEGPDGEGPDGL